MSDAPDYNFLFPVPIRSKLDPSIIGVLLCDPRVHPLGYVPALKLTMSAIPIEGEHCGFFTHSYQYWDFAGDDEARDVVINWIQESVGNGLLENIRHEFIHAAMIERQFYTVQ